MIACAYFFPGRRFRRALAEAAGRGVKVRLVLQGKIEYPFLHYASRGLYGALLDAGIEIHEYNASLLHAKVGVFDRRVACVGSSNIDPVQPAARAGGERIRRRPRIRKRAAHEPGGAIRLGGAPVAPSRWRQQPFWTRLRISVTYALARMIIGFYGFQRYR